MSEERGGRDEKEKEGKRHTKLKPNVRRPNNNLDLIIDFEIVFAPVPKMLIALFELGFVSGGEVGLDFAEDVGVYSTQQPSQISIFHPQYGGEKEGGRGERSDRPEFIW